jgi:hypothetical protein
MSKFRKIQADIKSLEDTLNNGTFIHEIFAQMGEDLELADKIASHYVGVLARIKAANDDMKAEVDKIKSETKHRIQAGLIQGLDAKSVSEEIGEEFGCSVYPTISIEYNSDDVVAKLRERDLYYEAVDAGAIQTKSTVSHKLLTGEMKEVLKELQKPRVSRLSVK